MKLSSPQAVPRHCSAEPKSCHGVSVVVLWVAALLSVWASNAVAVEYSIASEYDLVGRYHDNYRLTFQPRSRFDELHGGDFKANWFLRRNSERDALSWSLAMDAGAYKLDEFNTVDGRTRLSYRRSGQKGNWNVYGGYNYDSTRITEETVEGSGLFGVEDTRTRVATAGAGWFRQLSEKNTLNFNVGATVRTYDTDQLADFEYIDGSLLWQYFTSNRMRLQTRLGQTWFDSEDDSNVTLSPFWIDPSISSFTADEVDATRFVCVNFPELLDLSTGYECTHAVTIDNEQYTTSLQVGVLYALTPQLTLDVLVGMSYLDTDLGRSYSNIEPTAFQLPPDENIDGTNTNTTYAVTLEYDAERLDYTLSANSRESANSAGALTLNTRVAFDVHWRIAHRSRTHFELSWFEQETATEEDITLRRRQLSRAQWQYFYKLNEHWTVGAEYRYYKQELLDFDDHADGNEVLLHLKWNPQPKNWSR